MRWRQNLLETTCWLLLLVCTVLASNRVWPRRRARAAPSAFHFRGPAAQTKDKTVGCFAGLVRPSVRFSTVSSAYDDLI